MVGRRSRVALPIENGLGAAGHLLRHEAQLDEGLEAQSPIIIHNPVKIGEVVPLMLCALSVRPGLVDGHVIAEEAVAADVLEMAQRLGHGKLVVVFLLHRQTHAACTDAVSSVVVEARPAVRHDGDIQRFHHIHLYPQGNKHFEKVIPEYRALLTTQGNESFIDLTYESLFDMMEAFFTTEKQQEWLKYLRRRYLF